MSDRGAQIVQAIAHVVAARDELRKAWECARAAEFMELAGAIASAGRVLGRILGSAQEAAEGRKGREGTR